VYVILNVHLWNVAQVKNSVLLDLATFSDVSCMVDVLVQFNVALELDGVIIEDRRIIIKDYLKGSFIVDLVSSIPWELVCALPYQFLTYISCQFTRTRLITSTASPC
jgi:hypothetical protein